MAKNLRLKQLGMIHIGKKALQMDNDTYRAMLMRVTGRDSSGSLSMSQRFSVIAELKRLGWSAKGKSAYRSKVSGVQYKEKLSRLMIVQWNKLHDSGKVDCGSNECFESWVANRIRPEGADLPKTKHPDTLESFERVDLVEILKKWVARKA